MAADNTKKILSESFWKTVETHRYNFVDKTHLVCFLCRVKLCQKPHLAGLLLAHLHISQPQLSLTKVEIGDDEKVSLHFNITDVRPFLQRLYDGFENGKNF